MAKHTQGPWTVCKTDHETRRPRVEILDADNWPVAHVYEIGTAYHSKYSQPVNENAALIAAAPELLAACLLLIEQHDASGDYTMGGKLTNEPFLLARAAIAKATA